ncbi:MAG: glycosyltransferase [Desulfarculaceae bacterium]|nr:glycosyltransferase [Desulfarculaceae bacterium]MCF8047640.1 glycosyltransferase [Desulfarculaceae bacterium]MCF8064387.1 glycosyltransferase [Desulfarculaceae bacterium]MCF8099822.1 glycosyltransferase [Desulfarculaceae bacterium]MCF8124437.1 glycosyltransferase [Desulfarculaceae bacterium]
MPFYTALRGYTNKRLEEIAEADILIGIPCYNNETTIAHVVQMVTHGLADHYGDKRAVILVADGGSTDDTREVAKEFEIKPWQEKIVSIYRGLPGKGSALRAVFEAATRLKVTACAMVDSDLRSITGDWVKALIDPVMTKGYQYVSPVYLRHKYDGTITNNIVYNLTRALYGKRVRQPIGGDFAISLDLAKFYAEQDVWESEVARFGIDIWMTTSAITQGFKVCQANLGLKVHDAKDPASHLGPMFRQVIWTLFNLMERYEGVWKTVEGSEPVETFGNGGGGEPEPVNVNLDAMIENFQSGYKNFSALWKEIFCGDCFKAIEAASTMDASNFSLPTEAWIQILYELAATYHSWDQHRMRLLDLVTPLYYARVASFVRQSWDMTSAEAETLVEEQAQEFEDHKDYLVKVWGQGPGNACLR